MKKIIISLFIGLLSLAFAGCEQAIQGDPQRDWQADAAYFASSDEQVTTTFYKPYAGYVGDPMPFYDPQTQSFKVCYLLDFRPNPVGTYHPIWGVETKDAAQYTSLNEVLSCGGINEQDAALGTGSVVYDEASSTYYFFYTGHRHLPKANEATEAVMYATSKDFKTWNKSKTFLLIGSDYGYSAQDFRDPYLWADEDGLWHMIVSTSANGKGVLAEFTSANLQDWEHVGVFSVMVWGDRFMECTNVFQMGEWWYMTYSDQSDFERSVHYIKASSLAELRNKINNPGWPDNKEGKMNSRAFYAGNTASDGVNRYMWGWVPTRDGKDNTATAPAPDEPNWAGTLIAHKILQHEDGTLTLVEVPALAQKYNQEQTIQIKEQDQYHTLYSRLEYHNRITCTITTASASDKFGISFCRGIDSKKYYTLVFNPESDSQRKINFEQEGPEGIGFLQAIDSYLFPTPEDNTYHITLVNDNSVLTMYVNDVLCYTNRIYGIAHNCWSINTYDDAQITTSDLKILTY